MLSPAAPLLSLGLRPISSMAVVLDDGEAYRVMVLAFLSTSSLRDLARPQKKKSRAARITTDRLAMIMPAMAPLARPFLLVWNGVFEDGSGDSAGNGSPGFNMYELLRARSSCVEIGVEALGLIAPTMAYVMHDPGAEQ